MGKIGIMGGTFDPIHNGHLLLGEQAYEEYGLDQIWYMPSGQPPHKKDHNVTAGRIRLDMTRLAMEGHEGFTCSDFEVMRSGNTYTSQTLEMLHGLYPGHTFYFIIGADSLYEIEHWHEPEKVLAQAVILAAVREYVSVESILQRAADRGEAPLIVVCDEISDPHNLGAIIRTAECAGAHGVIIPKRRSAGLTAVVAKTSAGAVAHVPVARVPNIPSLLKDLKKQGVWVFGTAAQGTTSLYDADLKGPAAIVIGSEGEGMTRLAMENCDFLVSIPMRGKLNSLNASAAAAILLYEAVRQRG